MTDRHTRGGRNMYSKNARDCGVRTLAIAGNIPYQEALDRLAEKGRTQGLRVGTTYWWQMRDVLEELGFRIEVKPPVGTLRTVPKNYPGGVWILYTRDHWVTAVDGTVYDAAQRSLKRVKYAMRITE